MFMLKSLHGEADRKVPAQPEIFNNGGCNGRKLSELPFHLIRSNRIDELFSKVFFHYKFLFAKLSCNPLNNLIADFEDYLANFKYNKEVVLVSDALRLASSILSISAGNLVPQIIGRLLPYVFINSKKFANVKSLVQECESDGLHNCALVPAFNCFQVPGGPLVYSLDAHPFAVYGIYLMADETQLLSVSNRFIVFDLSSGDVVRVINPGIEGIMQSLSVSGDRKYCVSFSNNDQIIICNTISGDVKVLNRYTTATPVAEQPSTTLDKKGKNVKEKETKDKQVKQAPAPSSEEGPASVFKDYTDTLIGSNAGLNYFVIWSKYFFYVYDKKGRIVKAEKRPYPIIQIEMIENKSVENYGIELELITRSEDCRDDEDKERDHLILQYICIVDPFKLPKKNNKENIKEITESDVLQAYLAQASLVEIHSCLILTKDKKKLFACADIGDNIIQCYRNRAIIDPENPDRKKNVWRFHGSLDDNLSKIFTMVLSDDENYLLAVVEWGFKVISLINIDIFK